MNVQLNERLIPGTILEKEKMGNVTGLDFLKKVFYITDGIMLSQIREISGIDGSTLQNWTKRGWVENSKLKRYNIDQLAHILIINMLRSCMQLDRIAFIINYINGSASDGSDDIIRYSELYDYICRLLDGLILEESPGMTLQNCIRKVTANYEERISGAHRRLDTALEIIITAYYSALLKKSADEKLAALMRKK
jgi:hypothetical protein